MDELISAYGLRGDISVDQAWNIGKAAADWLPQDGTVAVAGRQGSQLCRAVIEGLRLQGRDVVSLIEADRDSLGKYISTERLAGGVRVGYDDLEEASFIELFDEKSTLANRDNGLADLIESANAGNFVPAARKGELSVLV